MSPDLEAEVMRRAGGRCEYCHMPQAVHPQRFHIDHIIAIKHGGQTNVENLALACYRCNLHKGPNIASIDPESGQMVRLFHPREDRWEDHFQWQGTVLIGLTPIGRATIRLLTINADTYVRLRVNLQLGGIFPFEV